MEPRYLLIADEHLSHVNYLVQHLLNRGHRIETAELGASACSAILRRRAAGNPYDLAILDLNLPQMDAVGIARDLRARGDPTPLIIHASGARSDQGLTRLLAGLRLVSVYDRPIDLALVDAELAAVAPHTVPASPPGAQLRTQADPFFGTARVQRTLDDSGPRPALSSPPTQALERRTTAVEPAAGGPVPAQGTGRISRPQAQGTGAVQRPASPPDVPPSTRFARGGYRTPVGLPVTVTTSRVRRSVTGSITAPPAGTPPSPATATSARLVACAYCSTHFQVPIKTDVYQAPCVHCGKINLINPQ
jgi:CheY-like chemotaxis protein